jgi:hypothetical protein
MAVKYKPCGPQLAHCAFATSRDPAEAMKKRRGATDDARFVLSRLPAHLRNGELFHVSQQLSVHLELAQGSLRGRESAASRRGKTRAWPCFIGCQQPQKASKRT